MNLNSVIISQDSQLAQNLMFKDVKQKGLWSFSYVYFVCMCTCVLFAFLVPISIRCLDPCVLHGYKPPCGLWKPNLGSLQEQVPLTAELSPILNIFFGGGRVCFLFLQEKVYQGLGDTICICWLEIKGYYSKLIQLLTQLFPENIFHSHRPLQSSVFFPLSLSLQCSIILTGFWKLVCKDFLKNIF